jgi:SAM-dependent methyltransferase
MTDTFGAAYAEAYDPLYADKDYAAETDLIERLAGQYVTGPVHEILDLGCGTGRHAVALAERGYRLVGVDRSPRMLDLARERASAARVGPIEFLEGDVRTVRLGRQFDVVLLMFAVLGYQIGDHDVRATLETVRLHLRPAGIVILDVWWGPAVESIGPSERTKVVSLGDRELERRAVGRLEPGHVCTVDYELVIRNTGGEISRDRESHRMRYFFGDELSHHLGTAGLELRRLSAFPEVDRDPDRESWNALAVAQRTPVSGDGGDSAGAPGDVPVDRRPQAGLE